MCNKGLALQLASKNIQDDRYIFEKTVTGIAHKSDKPQ